MQDTIARFLIGKMTIEDCETIYKDGGAAILADGNVNEIKLED